MTDDEFHMFFYKSINRTRWASLVVNLSCAALWIIQPSWGSVVFIPVHVGVAIYTFRNGGKKLREMTVAHAIKKLQGR